MYNVCHEHSVLTDVPAPVAPYLLMSCVVPKEVKTRVGLLGYFELHCFKSIFSSDQFGGKFSVSIDENSHRLESALPARA